MKTVWHSMDKSRITPEDFIAVIEIEKGSNVKYELDKETGYIIVDRILYTSTHYPGNYGFIPKTYGDDNDPLDVIVLCSETIQSMSLIRCYPIGVLNMVDGGENDEKIIAIPFNDPTYNSCKSVNDLPYHIFEEMKHFFSVYKALEHKETTVETIGDENEAKKIIEKAIANYHTHFPEED